MTKLISLKYTDKHLISIYRILSEYEIVAQELPNAHGTIKNSINEALAKDYHTRIFIINRTEANYLFTVFTWRITQLNQSKLLSGIAGLHDEIKGLIPPLEEINPRKFKVLSLLLEVK